MNAVKNFFNDFSISGLAVLFLTIFAMYLTGEKIKIGWLFFTISQIIQIYIFYEKKQGFLILTMIFLIIMNVVNYFKWT